MEKIRILDRIPPEYAVRVDLAKPGSDRTAVLMLGKERLELAYLPQPPVTLWPRRAMLNAWARTARKSQKATRRQQRFARNKAKRLRDQRAARRGLQWPKRTLGAQKVLGILRPRFSSPTGADALAMMFAVMPAGLESLHSQP